MALTEPSQTPLGTLGDWILLERLGRGGQGSTFKARHATSGQLAALKRFRVADMSDWKRFDLFEREARTLEALDHPAIPRFFGSGASADGAERWIAMELVEGEPLSRRLAVPSAPELLARVFSQALDVLAYLHGRAPPVVHRDLKPHNFILRPDQRLALVDFGSVRTALAPEGSSTVVGTFGYLAPEQLHGAASPAADLFSLGVTMIALASGIEGNALPRRGLRIDAERVLASYPERTLARVWTALIEPDPERRPCDVAAVRALLGGGPQSLPATPALAVRSPAPPPRPALNPFPAWTPRGPLGRLLLFILSIVLRVGSLGVGLFERRLLPRIQERERARLARSTRKDPLRQGVALAQLAHHHEVQRLRVEATQGRLADWRGRLQRHASRRLPPGPKVLPNHGRRGT